MEKSPARNSLLLALVLPFRRKMINMQKMHNALGAALRSASARGRELIEKMDRTDDVYGNPVPSAYEASGILRLTKVQQGVLDRLDEDRLFFGDEGFEWVDANDSTAPGPSPRTVRVLSDKGLINSCAYKPYGSPYWSEWVKK